MPTAPLLICIEPGCPVLSETTRCPKHERMSTRNHRGVSRQARGYDAGYERERATLLGQSCALRLPGCTGIAESADHGPIGLRPACRHCNYRDGQRRMVAARAGVGGYAIAGSELPTRTALQPHSYDVSALHPKAMA